MGPLKHCLFFNVILLFILVISLKYRVSFPCETCFGPTATALPNAQNVFFSGVWYFVNCHLVVGLTCLELWCLDIL